MSYYPSVRIAVVLRLGRKAVRKLVFKRHTPKKFESRSSYLPVLLQTCCPYQPSDVTNLSDVRRKELKGTSSSSSPYPYYCLYYIQNVRQGEGTPLLWRVRGPSDPWEVVIEAVFPNRWDSGVKPSPGRGRLNG